MGNAKQIVVRPIDAADARRVIQAVHYSGKVVQNSTLHMGVFYLGRLEGAMQFGSPLDRRKVLPLVRGTLWNQMLELNRMAFGEALPRNSESRALGVAFRVMRKHRPDIKWILSFSDATQCGDGTIYRASGFVLTQIKESGNLARLPSGEVIHKMTLESNTTRPRPELGGRSYANVAGGSYDFDAYCRAAKATVVPGYQLRYIRFIDPEWATRLTVPVIPFDQIPAACRMYRGEKTGAGPERGAPDQGAKGGADPTPALHSHEVTDGR
jgi:hypothetical protein